MWLARPTDTGSMVTRQVLDQNHNVDFSSKQDFNLITFRIFLNSVVQWLSLPALRVRACIGLLFEILKIVVDMETRLLTLGQGCYLNRVGALRPVCKVAPPRRLGRHVVVHSQNASDTTDMISEAEKFMESMIEESPAIPISQQSPADLLSEREAILKQVRSPNLPIASSRLPPPSNLKLNALSPPPPCAGGNTPRRD